MDMAATRELRNAGWLKQPSLVRVLTALDGAGEEARVVGGAVRNALLGLPPGDIDIATTATPDEIMRRAEAAGIKAVPTGVAHGTVTLVADGHPFEVTTLREDVETFGRHARVHFGRNWEHDAQRRDFTINALSLSADGTVHDYVGGLADIEARRVRFIGDADRRIAEDYLRILRFFRFHAAFGRGDPDAEALAACIRGRAGVARLSAERVHAELTKLLVAPGASEAARVLSETGLLQRLIDGIGYLGPLDAMIAVEAGFGLAPDPVRRLGALATAVPEDAARLTAKLRLSNAEARRLDSMAARWWRLAELVGQNAGDHPFKARIYRLGKERYRDRLLMAIARCAGDRHRDRWKALFDLAGDWPAPPCPYRAADFIARGFEPGPALGDLLARAEDAWIEAGFPSEPERQAAIADAAVAAFRHDHRL